MRTQIPTVLVAVTLAVTTAIAQAPPAKVTYDTHVLPILRDQCFACHNQDKKKGGLQVHTFTNLMQGGSSGVVIKPGDANGSYLFKTITHKIEPHMPPKSPMMAKESIETIRQWIASGALENAGSKVVVVNKPKIDIGLTSIVKGKPAGPPPMPEKPLSLEPVVQAARANAVTALASSPWAPLLAVAGHRQVLLYHSDTLELLGVLPFPEGTPHVLRFSRNGSLLLAGGGRGGKSGRVVVWGVKTGERIFEVGEEVDAVLAADISADQTQIALGGPSKVIRIYSTRDGKLQHEIKKHTDWLYTLEFSPDGVLLASGDRNGGLFVWEAHTGREFFSLRGHTAAITEVSWRHDSNVLASGSEDSTVRLWEMENGGMIKNWGAHGGGVQAVRYHQNGQIASSGRDRLTKLWDGNGTALRAFEALPDVAMRVAFTHDGARVVGGDWTGQVRVWTGADGKPVGTLSTSPPSLAQRLESATKELAAAQAAFDQLSAVATTSQAAAQKATAELAAAQKAVTDTAAAAKTAAGVMVAAKSAADKATAALAPAQRDLAAKDVVARSFAEAVAKIKDAADKAKDNKELAAALVKSQAVADQSAAEVVAAQKTVTDLGAAAKAAADQHVAAQKAQQATAAAAATAPAQIAPRTAAVTAANTKAAADKAAADKAAARLIALRGQVEKLKAGAAVVKQPAK